MKRQIRRGVFETNSSSVHSITMCSDDEYNRWKNEELLYSRLDEDFTTLDEIKRENRDVDWDDGECVKEFMTNEGFQTYDEFFENYDFETYKTTYTTKSGELIHAFGYYGHD